MTRRCSSCGAINRVPSARLAETARCGQCKHALPPAATPIEITNTTTFDDIVRSARVPVLVDFWAPWCGPCRMVAPEVEKVAETVATRAIVLKVNTDQLPELAARYRLQGIPTFAVFDRGTLITQRAGASRAPELLRMVVPAHVA